MGDMKHLRQRSSGVDCVEFTSKEMAVAGTLVRMNHLISKSGSRRRLLVFWGSKKKRSVNHPPANYTDSAAPDLTPKLKQHVSTTNISICSSSPTSPLIAFPSPSNSDSKPPPAPPAALPLPLLKLNQPMASSSSLLLKGDLLKQCQRLSDLRRLLKQEVNKVEAYRDELMAQNIILRDRKQQACEAQSQSLAPQPHHQQVEQHPLMGYPFPYHQTGPSGIPDLNVSPEEYTAGLLEYPQPSDMEYHHQLLAAKAEIRAAAAVARRNRSLIQKAKISSRLTRGNR